MWDLALNIIMAVSSLYWVTVPLLVMGIFCIIFRFVRKSY